MTESSSAQHRTIARHRWWRVLATVVVASALTAAGIPVAANAVGSGAGTDPLPAPLTEVETVTSAADIGGLWLATQINDDGYATSAFTPGQADPGITSDIALSLAAVGVGEEAFNRAVGWLRDPDNAEVVFGFGTDSVRPAAIGLLLLVNAAAGVTEPGRIGVDANGIDLLAALDDTRIKEPGPDEGRYGTADATFDGVYRQSLAILGQVAAGAQVPDDAVEWLAGQQCDDKSFPFFREGEAPCDGDADATALAIQATIALGLPEVDPDGEPGVLNGGGPVLPDVAGALTWLQGNQEPDGSWTYFGTSSENSTANAIGAIVAAGEDPTSERWTTEEDANPVSWLASRQLGCPSADRGAFISEFSAGGADLFSSRQALLGLTQTPLPIVDATFDEPEITVAPCAPTGVTAVPTDRAVTVSWTAPADVVGSAVTGYTVEASAGDRTCSVANVGEESATPATSCVVSGLANGTAYTFTVIANSVAGPSPASAPSAPVAPRTSPGAPRGVRATPGNRQVTVSWAPPTTTGGAAISGYRIERATTSANWATVATRSASARSFAVVRLTNGTNYRFRVLAVNQAGAGPASPVVSGTPRTVPGAPRGVRATPGNRQVTVAWTAPASSGGSRITGYRIQRSSNGRNWSRVAARPASARSFAVRGLARGTTYRFRVVAVNVAGPGSPSGAVTARPR